MKRFKKIKKSVTLSSNTEQEAATLLSQKNYKKALEHYKGLLKQEDGDQYRDAVRDCYLGRAIDLVKKGMYREAVVMWENHCIYCTGCQHSYLYIHLLLAVGLEAKAATVFVQNKLTLNEIESSKLEEIFAVLLLTGPNEWVSIFPEGSILRKHLSIANLALTAVTAGNWEGLDALLKAISFRSPYKQLRLVLQSCLLLLRGNDPALAVLERVPVSSFFYPFAHMVKLALSSPLHLARSLPQLSQAEFDFLSGLKGWAPDQQNYLNKLRHLSQPLKPKILFDWALAGASFIPRSIVKRACYTLLPFYPQAVLSFENQFGKLSPEEKAHLMACTSIYQKHRPAPHIWMDYEAALASCQPQTPLIALKRALTLRHVVNLIEKEHGLDCRCSLSKRNLLLLEKSLELDPLDQAVYLQLIKRYRNEGNAVHSRKWADKAVLAFPKERSVLIAAIEAMHDDQSPESPDHAIHLASQLLTLDPINPLAHQYMRTFQLAKARQLILQKKWEEAKRLLAKLKLDTSPSFQLTLQLNEGLCEYQQGNLSAAHHLMQQCGIDDIEVYLQLLIEASQLRIQLNKMEQAISPLLPNKVRINDKAQLLRLIDVMNQAGPSIQWKEIMAQIKKPLRKAAGYYPLAATELMTICECFTKSHQFEWVPVFVNKQFHLQGEPIFIYYTIHAKIKGDSRKMKRHDYYMLEKALEKAAAAKDVRTMSLITRLLEGAYEDTGFFPPEGLYEAMAELMEELNLR